MSTCFLQIALYNTLRKIPEVSDDEAKEAVTGIASAKDVATNDYIDTKIEKMARVLIMWMVGVGVAVAGVVIAVVG